MAGDDIYVVNSEGHARGRQRRDRVSLQWTISTLGGPLAGGHSAHRLYLESIDGDMFIVDRDDGDDAIRPPSTHERGQG